MKNIIWMISIGLCIVMLLMVSACAPQTAPPQEKQAEPEAAQKEEAKPAEVQKPAEQPEKASGKKYTVAIVHLQEGNPYFDVASKGAKEAASELGVELIFKGPASMDVASQIELVDSLIAQKVDAIGISAIDPNALVPVGKKAMDAGIKFYSWDSPVAPEGRLVHSDAANPEDLGRVQVQLLGEMIGYEGEVVILSAGATNENSNLWNKWSEEELKDAKYSKIKLLETVYGDDDYQKSYNLAQAMVKKYPNLKGIISPTSVGIVAASKFLTDEKLCGKIYVAGLGLPSEMAEYIRSGCCKGMALWSPIDQGYLIVYMGYALADGKITPKAGEKFKFGRMGELEVIDKGNGNLIIYQGKPMIFDQKNIDEWAPIF